MNSNRRIFFQSGLAAGAGLSLATLETTPAHAGTKSVSGEFTILGIKGIVQLTLDEEIPDGSSFRFKVENLSPKTAITRRIWRVADWKVATAPGWPRYPTHRAAASWNG